MKYKEALEKIARVNAMDYEYQAWAKEALAQPEQKPVAWMIWLEGNVGMFSIKRNAQIEFARRNEAYPDDGRKLIPLYTTPPQRTWVGLTEEDIDDAEIHLTSCRNNHESWIEGIQEFAQAIEAKLKEKNT